MADIFNNDLFIITKATLTDLGQVLTCKSVERNKDFWIEFCPTGNCQISSIASCESIIELESFSKIIKSLYDTGYISKQLIIDICDYSSWKKIINDNFDVVFSNDYTSTNRSEMIIYLIRLTDIEEEDDDYYDDID